jgi:aromatic-L-amino-acid decarboxylase
MRSLSNLLTPQQSTASDSALIAVVAARSLYQREHPDVKLEDLAIYTTTQTHSLGLKAGLVLGLSVRALEVQAEDGFSLRGETLRQALEDDEKQGKRPFILSKCSYHDFTGIRVIFSAVATVGTTSSGAIDNIPEIQQIGKTKFGELTHCVLKT